MKRFTANSSLYSVRHCKEFKSFKKYILAPRGYAVFMQAYKIKHLNWFYPMDSGALADALSKMRERIAAGEQIYYPLYDDVGVYAFTVNKKAPFVLVLPGGGYGDVCSIIEGYTVALHLNSLGINAFIGQYRVGKNAQYPNVTDDVANILKFIEENSEKFKVEFDDYAVCGFSAGGHLAGLWASKLGYKKYGLRKPNVAFLSYPVVTLYGDAHRGSVKNLLGEMWENTELQKQLSLEYLVDRTYPKTFLWQCTGDKVVSIGHSRLLDKALTENNIEHIYRSFDDHRHGLGLGVNSPAEGWLDEAVKFWREQ